MSTIKVDVNALFVLANDLTLVAGTLATESNVRGDYNGRSGSPQVDQALAKFFGNWSDGLNAIQEHLTGLSTRVSDAAEGYEAVEHEIEQAAAMGTQPGG
jgi:hypothetical protein